MSTLVTLESGFLAPKSDMLHNNKPDVVQRSFISGDAMVTPKRRVAFDWSSRTIDDLFQRYQDNHLVIKDFEYREELLIAYHTLFGGLTGGLYNFVLAQVNNPYLSSLHTSFLEDLLRAVNHEKRQQDIGTWFNIFSYNHHQHNQTRYREVVKKYFNRNLVKDSDELLLMWLESDGSYTDLLISLKLIFGTIWTADVKQ